MLIVNFGECEMQQQRQQETDQIEESSKEVADVVLGKRKVVIM